MRKRKLSSVGLAAILTASLVSGGIFAWFISQDTSAQVIINTPSSGAGGDKVIIDKLVPENPEDIEPGVPTPLVPEKPGVTDPVIENKTDKPLVLELDLSSKSIIGMLRDGFNPDDAEDWLAEDEDIYKENQVTIGQNTVTRYTFSEDRIKEVAKLSIDSNINDKWVTVASAPGFYYTVVDAKDKVSIEGLSITILGELGGLKKDENGLQSRSRQFEQKSEFSAEITLSSAVAQEDSVISQFGTDVLDALRNNNFIIN